MNTGEVVHPSMAQTETNHNVCGNPVSSAGVKLKKDGGLQRQGFRQSRQSLWKHKNWSILWTSNLQLSREIYVQPPPEAGKENILWKLNMALWPCRCILVLVQQGESNHAEHRW